MVYDINLIILININERNYIYGNIAKIGRRKKVFNTPEDETDSIYVNRDVTRNIFAQYIKNTTARKNHFNEFYFHTLKLNMDDKRTKRSDYTASRIICQHGFKELLENEIIVQSLLASSILWKYWNQNIIDVAITPLLFSNIEKKLKHVNKKLELIGPWGALMGKYGTTWIIKHYRLGE